MSDPMNTEPEPEQVSQGGSSWFNKKIGRKLSLARSPKETPKETTGPSETTKEATDQSGIGQKAMDEGEETKTNLPSENMNVLKDTTGKGENIGTTANQGDAAEAIGQTGLHKDSFSKKKH
ncbi:hypothetical protein N7513_012959 [Penicillium frequentans]|nr:hypothetical protein N7513_012959 [Penicillium glabrum]